MGEQKFDLGHVTKMAIMPLYGKNPSKIFSETRRPMTFKVGIQLVTSALQNLLTLTYFMARSTLLPNTFIWENA